MTPQDMNMKIAEILGLEIALSESGFKCTAGKAIVVRIDGKLTPRDYTTDKALCWDLIEMLLQAGWEPWYFEHDKTYKWRKYDAVSHKDIITYDKSLLLATCAALSEEFSRES